MLIARFKQKVQLYAPDYKTIAQNKFIEKIKTGLKQYKYTICENKAANIKSSQTPHLACGLRI